MPRLAHRLLVVVACIALGAAVFAVSSAGARMVTPYNSKVVIQHGPPAFHGEVQSEHHPCVNQRHVAMFREQPGDDEKLGGDKTGPAGRFHIHVNPLSSGAYYARARAKQQIVSGNGYTCEKDRSKTVVVD